MTKSDHEIMVNDEGFLQKWARGFDLGPCFVVVSAITVCQ